MYRMLSKTLIVLFFSSFSFSIVSAQQLSPAFFSALQLDGEEFLGYDSFGYYYQIKNNVFSKKKGTETFEYKNVSLGKITKVDLQNPLKMVLFYENFNTVVLLDNQLNETSRINFSQNAIPIVATAVGMSSQNQIWIYNSLNQQIGLFDYLKNEYKTVSTPFTENIQYYQTDFNTFYWIDEKNNWFSCNIFGKTTTLGKIPRFDAVVVLNSHQFIFSKANLLYLKDNRDVNSETVSEIEVLEKTFTNFLYKDQILSIFTPQKITNYKIVIP
jgi:hypothetical protein